MYRRSWPWYDVVYAWKDYRRESARVAALLRQAGVRRGARVLDVACGTGRHLERLRRDFRVEGVDVSARMLDQARARLPGVPLHRRDMRRLRLPGRFGAVTCLFSSVGYVRTLAGLRAALRCMAAHLEPGGVLLLEPWFGPKTYLPGTLHARTAERPDLRLCRMVLSRRRGRTSVLDMHHLVGTPGGVRHFVERHVLGLFSREEYRDALREAGLRPRYLRRGLMDRGLWLARRPAAPTAAKRARAVDRRGPACLNRPA